MVFHTDDDIDHVAQKPKIQTEDAKLVTISTNNIINGDKTT